MNFVTSNVNVKFFIFSIIFSNIISASSDLSISYLIKELNLTQRYIEERGAKEIESFVSSGVWAGGYYEGNPLSMFDKGSYHHHFPYKGQMVSPLYICYVECLKPYINETTDVLEIGPGHGAWTKAILQLNPRSITCVDALPAEYNKFWEYVGPSKKVKYYQIKDFSLNCLQDNSVNFVFSFGTFCHISPLMVFEYFKNMHKKLRDGARGFVMYADYDKKNNYAKKYNEPMMYEAKQNDLLLMEDTLSPRWYHMGIERAKNTLIELGYTVVDADVDVNERDPIVHFVKTTQF